MTNGAPATRAAATAGPMLIAIDRTILAVFVVEIALRIAAHGWRFFRDPWRILDFIVVAIALVPASGQFSVLPALRILSPLTLLSTVPTLRRVVPALLSAIPGLGAIIALLSLIFYVSAVMATKLFGASFPDWFGTIGESLYSLFQIMTLESWSMTERCWNTRARRERPAAGPLDAAALAGSVGVTREAGASVGKGGAESRPRPGSIAESTPTVRSHGTCLVASKNVDTRSASTSAIEVPRFPTACAASMWVSTPWARARPTT